MRKYPGPEDQALISPHRGVINILLDMVGVLEYWSIGILGYWKLLFPHYSNIPSLQAFCKR